MMWETSPSSSPRSKKANTTMLWDWSTLPTELLELILQKLVCNFVDVIRFKAVCKSWLLVSLNDPPTPPPQLPWLALSSNQTITNRRSFYSLSDNRHYTLTAPASRREYCCGSSHGWLFMEESFRSCSLLNPVTKVRVKLPSLRTLLPPGMLWDAMFSKLYKANQGKLITKGALSCSPASDDCWVVLILGRPNPRLAVCKLGQDSWRLFRKKISYQDVIYFRGHFYTVDCDGRIMICDPRATFPVTREIKGPKQFKADKTYLVESSGELLLVRRFRGWSSDLEKVYKTVMFKILRQDHVSKEWVGVETLGCRSLFLGRNHSTSVVASDYCGCKKNCVYFTDNCFDDYGKGKAEAHDVGVYSLADGRIQPLPGYCCDEQFVKQPPFWIAPSP